MNNLQRFDRKNKIVEKCRGKVATATNKRNCCTTLKKAATMHSLYEKLTSNTAF